MFGKILQRADRFTVGLIVGAALGVLLPCSGVWDTVFSHLSNGLIMLLFFLYGVKLSRASVWQGLTHWRLQGVVFACTFVLFPILGLLMLPLWQMSLFGLPPELRTGLMYVCVLPSTIQASIAFTSMARGNVPAAVCAASISSLMGVFITPFLVMQLVGGAGEFVPVMELSSALRIATLILFPFVAGQVLQRWLGACVHRNKKLISWTDQAAVWSVLYLAFSHAMIMGVWTSFPLESLLLVALFCAVLLGIVLLVSAMVARVLGFSREDRIAVIFCGSKKSLATGIPMMNVLFVGGPVGLIALPLMIFHQLQLLTCATLANKWAND